MFNSSSDQISQNFLKVLILALGSLMIVLIHGCNKNHEKDFVKLDAPLKEILPQIKLTLWEEGVEITVGNTYSGIKEYVIESGIDKGTIKCRYHLFDQHTVEASRYIFTVVSYNEGGSGTFYYLTAIDKTTLKSVDHVSLDDRITLKSVDLTEHHGDTVSVKYLTRGAGTSAAQEPNVNVEVHFEMDQGKLKAVPQKN